MNDSLWRELEPLADRTDEQVERLLTSPQADGLKALIQEASAALPEGYSVSLDITLNVCDPERDHELPLLATSLAPGPDGPYVAHGDCTPSRYVVDSEICEVPHDRCPHCWAIWDFKIVHPDTGRETYPCPNCGYELGKQVKLLLDDDLCPHCEKGKMSMTDTTCDQCGMTIDPGIIAWG